MRAKGRSATGDRNGARTHPERRARGSRNAMHKNPAGHNQGEKHGNAVLTDALVRAIRGSNESARVIAQRIGVNRRTVARVLNRDTWSHVQ